MSEPHLHDQVQAFFDTFTTASDRLDLDLRVVLYLNHQDLGQALHVD